jgi:hypothetical protein
MVAKYRNVRTKGSELMANTFPSCDKFCKCDDRKCFYFLLIEILASNYLRADPLALECRGNQETAGNVGNWTDGLSLLIALAGSEDCD